MIRKIAIINSLLIIGFAGYFLAYPVIRASLDLRDPALGRPGVPQSAWRLFHSLTPRYADWARTRVEAGRAETVSSTDISGTEWPLFGSVFYLWGVENLQTAWDKGDHSAGTEPRVLAHDAIIAASDLVIDPGHATWVKKQWGTNYLHHEDVFYRMLVIGALTSREKLLHDHAHIDLLRDQVESLSGEIDSSPSGLLEDYPGECYPGDVMAALMCIKRADTVLGTDHSQMVSRAVRGFVGPHATRRQLPPYSAVAQSGKPISDARGCSCSYIGLTSPELWPTQARQWYQHYDESFWQTGLSFSGYREYANNIRGHDWSEDVDSGPVIAGHGIAASTFGIGAARKNGRFDRAYPLTAEMLVTVGELPSGVLALARMLSDLSDAPMLGESAILWQLSIEPQTGFPIKSGGTIPPYVWIMLSVVALLAIGFVLAAMSQLGEARSDPPRVARVPVLQVVAWLCLLIASVLVYFRGPPMLAMILFLLMLTLPIWKRKKPRDEFEDWPAAKADAEMNVKKV